MIMFRVNKQVKSIIKRVLDLKLFSILNRRKSKSNQIESKSNQIESIRNQIDVDLKSMWQKSNRNRIESNRFKT